MIYWLARERSANEGDMLTLICDSFDRSKLQLPMWPLNRTPKRTIYETIQRNLTLIICNNQKISFMFESSWVGWLSNHPKNWFWNLTHPELVVRPPFNVFFLPAIDFVWGASLVLTAVLCHGHGLFLFLTSREGMSAGSNWNWECVPGLQFKN